MKFITIEWLRKRGACDEGIEIFMDEFGKRASVEQVIDKLQQIERPDWEGWLMGQELEITKAMLEKGANIHADDDYALQCAAGDGRLKLVEFLVEKGANIHADDDYALRLAKEEGHWKVVKFLEKVAKKELIIK